MRHNRRDERALRHDRCELLAAVGDCRVRRLQRAGVGGETPGRGLPATALCGYGNGMEQTGGFTIAFAKDIDDARQRSLLVCNGKNGDCALAHAAQPSLFACMTLARNLQDQTKLYLASASTLATSRTNAVESCSKVSGRYCQPPIRHAMTRDVQTRKGAEFGRGQTAQATLILSDPFRRARRA